MVRLNPALQPGSAEFNPFEIGGPLWLLQERAKEMGAHSEISWKLIEISESFGDNAQRAGDLNAADLARAAHCLSLSSDGHANYWSERGYPLDKLRDAGVAVAQARLELSSNPAAADPSYWHKFFNVALRKGAPPQARPWAISLWRQALGPEQRAQTALSCVAQLSALTLAFKADLSRLSARDQTAAAELCAELCALSPELAETCRAKLQEGMSKSKGAASAKSPSSAAQSLLSALEGIDLSRSIPPAPSAASQRL